MVRALLIFVLTLAVPSGAAAWTVANPDGYDDAVSPYYIAQGGVSLAQATEMALQRFPGRVARAETVTRGGRRIHEIRILDDDGRVRTVRVDASTGRFL